MTSDPRPGVAILAHDECWSLLRTSEVGRLAVAFNEQPDIFPVNFVVDHGTVVFRTAEGTKLAAAVAGQAVAFEVDGYEPASGDAWSVVIKGRAVEVEQAQEIFDALDLPLFPWHAAPEARFVRVEPDEVSGRRFRVVESTARDRDPPASHRSSPE